MSVKKVPADEIKRLRANVESYYKTVKAKSGAAAKEAADEAAKKYKRESPYKGPSTEVVKSGNAEPYKITGGAGSTANAGKPQGTQDGHHVTTGKNTTKPARGGFAGGGFGVGLMPGEQIK